jgi:SAM-dependent methyltransferase
VSLIEAWDRQQEFYIGAREARFEALLSVVEWRLEATGIEQLTVVDLCCGPAAIGQRLLQRFPEATYIGIDIDPVLLELARRVGSGFAPGRVDIVECDVSDARWLDHVPVGQVDVVCSSTALHWLSDDDLDRTLEHAWRALRPDGVLLNADHLGHSNAPACTELAGWIAARDAARAALGGSLSWHGWWEAVRADAQLAPLCALRDEIFPPTEPGSSLADAIAVARSSTLRRPLLADFVAASRRAGFVEVDTIWQRFDDRIVMAVKAANGQP